MGGNAFEQYGKTSLRMRSEDIPHIINDLYQQLPILLEYRPYPVKSILEKTDHGDIDIVIDKGETGFTKVFNAVKSSGILYFKNGSVVSLLLHGKYQIDLIFTKTKYYEYSCQYYNWNDLGNLNGRLAKPNNIKHGHDGFGYIYYYNNDKSRRNDIYIGNNYQEFLTLIGVKPYDDNFVFETYKQVFDYVVSSPYFNSKLYLFENLNNTNRVRDKKRKTYNMFLDYIKDIPPKEPTYIDVLGIYPHLKNEIASIDEQLAHKDVLRGAIDVDYVLQSLGMSESNKEGRKVGRLIGYVKNNFSESEIINNFQECVNQAIKKDII